MDAMNGWILWKLNWEEVALGLLNSSGDWENPLAFI